MRFRTVITITVVLAGPLASIACGTSTDGVSDGSPDTGAPGVGPTYGADSSSVIADGSVHDSVGNPADMGHLDAAQGQPDAIAARPDSGGPLTDAGTADPAPRDAAAGRDTGIADAAFREGSSSADAAGSGARPCDIYGSAGTPCVAAHSTVRALYGAYGGPLYQLRRNSDGMMRDITALGPGGFADTTVQDSFCAGTTCTISIIYDQSPQGNNLEKAPAGATWLPDGGNESSASKGKTTVSGHIVYGVYVTGFSDNVAYRNNHTKGVATANQAEAMYMVVDGSRFSSFCCFDYGNAETDSKDDGNGTMEAIYWGTDTSWGGFGEGNGPWVAADLENGMFKGNKGGFNYGATNTTPWPTAQSVIAKFATTMLKGPSDNTFTLKAGNAQSGTLSTMWSSSRPSPNYSPKSLQGAIILGTGGDGSNGGTGTFFEGAMTSGNPSDTVDDAVQANVASAGYGR